MDKIRRCSFRTAKKSVFAGSRLVFAAIVSFGFPAAAAPNYFTRTWQMEQGLPQNKVTAVVQTRDGYLWVGTYNGLARFDGVRFTVFNGKNTPELHNRRITSLFEATDGTLWIGTESGDVFAIQGRTLFFRVAARQLGRRKNLRHHRRRSRRRLADEWGGRTGARAGWQSVVAALGRR